ncbi:WHG domain-containing protein [Plantibacter sp. RU18]|uniref:WHG domain-containing protein n=1 Tax=Plantibacter sp. RU18 TaxID=3158143 RepID=UPI003D368F83
MTDVAAQTLRPKFSRQRVIVGAAEFADAHGADALTLAALARSLGTSAPALLKHVRSTDDLRAAVAVLALAQLSSELDIATTGLHGTPALAAAAVSYQRFALAQPGRYALGFSTVDARTASGEPADRELVILIERVLAGRGLDSVAMTDAGRIVRAALHGYVSLELTGGFARGAEPSSTYDAMIHMLDRSPALGSPDPRRTA